MSKRGQQISAYFQQGRQLLLAGRLAEADQVFRTILSADPRHADSLHMLGVLALQTGHAEIALTWFDRAIALSPSSAEFHANRANALLALGRADDAEAASRRGLRQSRRSVESWQSLGHALVDRGRADEAVAAYREALALNPRAPDIHNNLGLALADANRMDDAVAAFRTAVARMPDDVTHINLASALKESGRLDEAEAVYRAILAAQPNHPVAHFNLGVLLLLAGRFAEGWREWEWRFQADPSIAWSDPRPAWTGEALAGRTLLVHGEQGFGDVIQFARYLPLLPRDGSVVIRVQRPLMRLLAGMPGVGRVVALDDPVPEADLVCASMSLPLLLNLPDPVSCPVKVPYLDADPSRVAAWRDRLNALPGRKVGLVWTGNPNRPRMDRRRSIPPGALGELASVPDITLISLQKDAVARGALGDRLADWTGELGDFADTAALVAELDLVISVDTAIVHLAGALGRPVWLLNRADTCWRWLLGRDDSDWYPTLRQFRQDRPGAWDAPIERMLDALRAL